MRPRVLRHRWFAVFTGAVGVSAIGHEFQRLALPLLVLDTTHSVAAAATLRVVEFLPFILWGPLAGGIIDRLDRRKVMLVCDLGSVATYGAMAIIATTDFAVWQIYALAFVAGLFEVTWALVTDFAVIPSLVDEDELPQANAVFLGTERGARVFGPVLAGIVIATLGTPAALVVSAVSFLATASVVFVMPAGYRLEQEPAPFTARAFLGEIGEGFGYVLRHPVLRPLLAVMFLRNLGGPGVQTVFLFFLREEVRLDATAIGVALSLLGVGQIAGSAAAPPLAQRRAVGATMVRVLAFEAASIAFAALARDWRLVVAGLTARALGAGAHLVFVYLPRQREIPPRLRGRANGAFRTLLIVGNSLSPALLSAVVERAGTSVAFGVASVFAVLAAALTALSPLGRYDVRPVAETPPAAASEEEVEAAAE